jgi:hypothetical protein
MQSQTIRLEFLWWLLTGLATTLILLPIAIYTKNYPFWVSNVLFIITFLTFTRYLFLLPVTFFAHLQVFKVVLLFLCIPIFVFSIRELNNFQIFVDYNDTEDLIGLMSYKTMSAMREYVYNEFLLFGVGSLVATVILPFRLVISVWRSRNTGKA